MKALKSNTSFLGKEVLHCKMSSVTIRKWHIKTIICTLCLGYSLLTAWECLVTNKVTVSDKHSSGLSFVKLLARPEPIVLG